MNRIFILVVLLICFLGCRPENPAPKQPIKIDLAELTITEIHNNYKNGTYNSKDLVATYIERIKEKDSLVNSITYLNANALKDAEKLDEEFKLTGELRPLHGIPMIVKDNFNTIGIGHINF